MIESEETGCEEGELLKDDMSREANPKIESCASSKEDNLVGDGGSSHTEDPMEIVKEDDGVEKEKVLDNGVNTKTSTSIEPDIISQTDNVVCEMELDMPHDSEAATVKLVEAVSSEANPSSEIHTSAEPDSIVSKVEPGMPSVSEGMDTPIEGASSEANTSGEINISGETDSVASKLEPGRASVRAVATEKLVDGTCSEANPFNETHLSGETESDVPNLGPCLSSVSEVATESLIDGVSSMAKSSNEPGLSVETDNVVCKVDPDIPCDSKVVAEKLTDVVSSKVTPSSEPHISVETDNGVCELKPNLPGDSEAATEKLIDGVSSDANPSSEPHISADTDNAVCEMVPDIPCDREVAAEKLIHGVSGEANPSNEPHVSAETDTVDCKVEPDNKLHVSGVATERTIEGLNIKDNSLNEPHMSGETDNVVSKVEPNMPQDNEVEMESESDDDDKKGETMNSEMSSKSKLFLSTDIDEKVQKPKFYVGRKAGRKTVDPKPNFLLDPGAAEDDDSGTEEERVAFIKEVENLYREKNLEFKAPKFYREELNLLKLWRAVVKLGGYEKVTSCKLWRQVGETFNPPKTCTTVSWTFRIFYEKALLEFEKDRLGGGELTPPADPTRVETRVQVDGSQTLGSGRTLRDAAARAMQGWHSQRLLSNGEVGNATSKDKHLSLMPKSDKQLRSSGLLKRKKPSHVDAVQVADMKSMKPRMDTMIFDVGPPSDWVKINVKRFSDCFEVYALVPGLLREEVHVQSDPAGRLIISGQPTQLDNPWGVTPFKKVVSLPTRIDPHQTSAVVTLNGQLYVRVPFEQPDF